MTCEMCKADFAPRYNNANKYCGIECYRDAQRAGMAQFGKARTNPDRVCPTCGVTHRKSLSKSRTGKRADNAYCTKACYQVAHSARRAWTCKGCNQEFQAAKAWTGKRDRQYCTMACRLLNQKADPVRCRQCDSWFTAVTFRNLNGRIYTVSHARVTCSQKCTREFYRTNEERKRKIGIAFTGPNHPAWKGGTNDSRGFGWQKIAEAARVRAGRACQDCGATEAELGQHLDVHHVVPFHNFDSAKMANKDSNLRALCRPCHMRAERKIKGAQIMMAFPRASQPIASAA